MEDQRRRAFQPTDEASAREQDMRDLLQALPVAIYTTDAQGYVTFFNEAAADFWGRRPVLGETRWCGAMKLFTAEGAPLPHELCPMAACLRDGRPVRGVQAQAERPDGERVFFQPYPTPLFNLLGDVTGAVNMLVDITAHKAGEARQASLIAELEAAKATTLDALEAAQAGSRAKSAFLANMSHELRTPLHGITGVVDTLSRTPLDAAQRQMLDVVADSASSLERILSNLLDLSRIEADRVALEAVEFDLAGLAREACDAALAEAREKGLVLDLTIAGEAEGRFVGDGPRIGQVLANLLSNAIKFTGRGRVEVRLDAAPDHVRIEVRDTGPGFDPETASRLFERFEQADSSVTRRFDGVGLGLPIARALARLMGGDLTVRSRPGVGSRFRLTLPLERVAAPADAPPRDAAPPPAPWETEALRVLVAEDHPNNRRVVQMMLEPLGFRMTFAENGQEAVEACGLQRFDLVLMDMQMPVMDGLTAIRAIRAQEAQRGRDRTVIAMLSANVSDQNRADAAMAGADGHIAKPATLASLLNGVSEAMARARDLGADSQARTAA